MLEFCVWVGAVVAYVAALLVGRWVQARLLRQREEIEAREAYAERSVRLWQRLNASQQLELSQRVAVGITAEELQEIIDRFELEEIALFESLQRENPDD